MRLLLLLFISGLGLNALQGQSFQEISTGSGYGKQAYIRLSDELQQQVNNNAWDIAFSTGAFDAGIFINESAGSSMGQPQAAIALFDADTDDFAAVLDPVFFEEFPLFNGEVSWTQGAFNELADLENPFDFGWGTYSPATHTLTGSRVYVVRLRSGAYRRVQIQQMADNTYTFRHAALDGSDEQSVTINKADFAGDALAYYSFAMGIVQDVEPAGGFDLLYCRYATPLDDGTPDPLDYAVTGILLGPGVEAVKAAGVDPQTVAFADHEANLDSRLDVIGHDWKAFDFNAGWVLPTDVAYFVKTAEGRVWKLVFVDFEGTSTGTAILEKTDLGLVSDVFEAGEAMPLATLDMFPNPVALGSHTVSVRMHSVVAATAHLSVSDMAGRTMWQHTVDTHAGTNMLTMPTAVLAAGTYAVRLQSASGTWVQRLVVAY